MLKFKRSFYESNLVMFFQLCFFSFFSSPSLPGGKVIYTKESKSRRQRFESLRFQTDGSQHFFGKAFVARCRFCLSTFFSPSGFLCESLIARNQDFDSSAQRWGADERTLHWRKKRFTQKWSISGLLGIVPELLNENRKGFRTRILAQLRRK